MYLSYNGDFLQMARNSDSTSCGRKSRSHRLTDTERKWRERARYQSAKSEWQGKQIIIILIY